MGGRRRRGLRRRRVGRGWGHGAVQGLDLEGSAGDGCLVIHDDRVLQGGALVGRHVGDDLERVGSVTDRFGREMYLDDAVVHAVDDAVVSGDDVLEGDLDGDDIHCTAVPLSVDRCLRGRGRRAVADGRKLEGPVGDLDARVDLEQPPDQRGALITGNGGGERHVVGAIGHDAITDEGLVAGGVLHGQEVPARDHVGEGHVGLDDVGAGAEPADVEDGGGRLRDAVVEIQDEVRAPSTIGRPADVQRRLGVHARVESELLERQDHAVSGAVDGLGDHGPIVGLEVDVVGTRREVHEADRDGLLRAVHHRGALDLVG